MALRPGGVPADDEDRLRGGRGGPHGRCGHERLLGINWGSFKESRVYYRIYGIWYRKCHIWYGALIKGVGVDTRRV